MDWVGILISIVKGAVALAFVIWILYLFYWVFKKIGFFRLFEASPSEEIFKEILDKQQEGKSFDEIFQEVTKYPRKKQKQYITAYIKINELKGGANER